MNKYIIQTLWLQFSFDFSISTWPFVDTIKKTYMCTFFHLWVFWSWVTLTMEPISYKCYLTVEAYLQLCMNFALGICLRELYLQLLALWAGSPLFFILKCAMISPRLTLKQPFQGFIWSKRLSFHCTSRMQKIKHRNILVTLLSCYFSPSLLLQEESDFSHPTYML